MCSCRMNPFVAEDTVQMFLSYKNWLNKKWFFWVCVLISEELYGPQFFQQIFQNEIS